jgi:hypothetical protein
MLTGCGSPQVVNGSTCRPVLPALTVNDITVDFKGNAYITNSAGNYIWKVNVDGD